MDTTADNTMKAWTFTTTKAGLEKCLTISSSAARPPPLAAGQTLVSVIAASLNPVDYKFPELPGWTYMVKTPATPSTDFSGRVVESKNPSLKPGQLVFGRLDSPTQFGTCAQLTVAPQEGCVAISESVDPVQAAAVGTAGLTAYQCIVPNVKGKTTPQRVFINGGSGGTGTYGIQIAKIMGCHVTTSCSTGNVALCKELGADEVIDYKSTDLSKALVEKANGSGMFDLVVDNVGSPANLYKGADHYLKADGKFVQVGAEISASGTVGMMSRMLRPSMLGGGKRSYQFLGVANKAEDWKQLGEWLAEGKMKSVVCETLAFEQLPKGYELLKTGRAKGKVVLKVDA